MVKEKLQSLILMDKAKAHIEKVISVDEAKEIRDQAEALRIYAQQANKGLEIQNRCAEIKIRAERKAGELLEKDPDIKRGGSKFRGETLKEFNVTKSQSHVWQAIAAIPKNEFETKIANIEMAKRELTSRNFYFDGVRIKREKDIKKSAKEFNNMLDKLPEDPDDIIKYRDRWGNKCIARKQPLDLNIETDAKYAFKFDIAEYDQDYLKFLEGEACPALHNLFDDLENGFNVLTKALKELKNYTPEEIKNAYRFNPGEHKKDNWWQWGNEVTFELKPAKEFKREDPAECVEYLFPNIQKQFLSFKHLLEKTKELFLNTEREQQR